MNDIERISPALKSKRNPIYKKTDRKMALILFYTMLPAFTASLAGAIVFNSMVMSLGTLFACLWIVAPLTSRIIIKRYWRCPDCNDILPNTWKSTLPTGLSTLACFPVYIEACPKCGHSLVKGKPPLTEEEILADKRKQRRKTAWILGVAGLGLFIELLIVLVLVKKGKI